MSWRGWLTLDHGLKVINYSIKDYGRSQSIEDHGLGLNHHLGFNPRRAPT